MAKKITAVGCGGDDPEEYEWTPGSGLKGKIDPNAAGCELRRIYEKYGRSNQTQNVVVEAQDPKNPLHPAFEWDNEKAGHQYRLTQARNLINHLAPVRIRIEGRPPVDPEKVFINVVDRSRTEKESGHVYVLAEEVRSEPELRCQVVERACRELEAWCRKYYWLEEIRGTIDQVAKIAGFDLTEKASAVSE